MSHFKLGLVGHQIQYSQSPSLYHAFASQTGISLTYTLEDISPVDFEMHIATMIQAGFHGCNVTQPFKHRAFLLAHEASSIAQHTHSANVLRFSPHGHIFAENTDGAGFIKDLHSLGLSIQQKRILILGAGGSVSSMTHALLAENPQAIWLYNRTLASALALQKRFPRIHVLKTPEEVSALDMDLLVDGTSFRDHPHPLLSYLTPHPQLWVYDLKYSPPLPTLEWAHRHQLQNISTGFGLLKQQAAMAFHSWTGIDPLA